ncbi:MAG: hypothetical protein IJV06_12620 [Bacteroidaceae bacterium]|nr:hypothetical protein [Bacteroidaceae bacterium]MBQ9642374.1 hypothetical protein [Bacteroidaceae bacterium]
MLQKTKWLAVLTCLFSLFAAPLRAQEVDDLQAYLDELAAQQGTQPKVSSGRRKAESVTIPVGLTEVDLSKFASYQSRTKVLNIKASVKFTNGIITAASNFAGGTSLLKVYGGASVVLDASAGVDASSVSSANCFAAVGIYESSTFYECGDITAPDKGTGIAIYIDGQGDTFNYVSGTLTGIVSNDNGGTVNGVDVVTYTKEELQEKLDAIYAELAVINEDYTKASTQYNTLAPYVPADLNATVQAQITQVGNQIAALQKQETELQNQLNTAPSSSYTSLNNDIEELAAEVSSYHSNLTATLSAANETAKAGAAADLQAKLTAMGNEINQLGQQITAMEKEGNAMLTQQIGFDYFLRKSNPEFAASYYEFIGRESDCKDEYTQVAYDYNTLVSQSSISNISDAVAVYEAYNKLKDGDLEQLKRDVVEAQTSLDSAQEDLNNIEINFPDQELIFNIRPTGITEEIQIGYKSNRGFVLTSAGMMQFEQVSGADFRLKDSEGNYLVAKAGSQTITMGTQAEATVWTGKSLGNGSYSFYSSKAGRYLSATAGKVNAAITAATSPLAWSITESDLDELQAFLNLLAEEDEVAEENKEQGTEEKDKDTLLVYIPPATGATIIEPIVLPRTPYPVKLVGDLPVPRPGTGMHPIYVPDGTKVILDSLNIKDTQGGDYIIYIDGTVEVNVYVNIDIEGWDWFAHIGPNGHVVWKPTGPRPRIWNEGTLDVSGNLGYIDNRGTTNVKSGTIDQMENTGTVNHTSGTITYVYNRKTYYFDGGVVTNLYNNGHHYHRGGTTRWIRNFSGGQYDMTSGSIRQTTVNKTDTIFVNWGTFNFTGGTIGGYGSRLLYHHKGAHLRIDGGLFDFTGIADYFIEAHDDFYIRGDYDYKATVPMLLDPSVSVRIIYNWTYKFNIVFIGGRPTPRRPIFYGDDFPLGPGFCNYIDWTLPNKRWRWVYRDEDNAIEVRDEEVEDEDDLQAYLDWLAENQEDESASTPEEPQELDLKNRTIVITEPVVLPVGTHVWWKRGNFVPKGWTGDNLFYVPENSSVKMDGTVIDVSSSTVYVIDGQPVQRTLFDVKGDLHFGPGSSIKGYLNWDYSFTDENIPGAIVNVGPTGRFYLDGGRFDNVVIRTGKVNIFVTVNVTYDLYIYVPTEYRYDGYRVFAPWSNFYFTSTDVRRIHLIDGDKWGLKLDDDGYVSLYDTGDSSGVLGDMNNDGLIDLEDITILINVYLGEEWKWWRNGDMNRDGVITVTDITDLIDKYLNDNQPAVKD